MALATLAALIAAPLPAHAQFSSILGSGKRGAEKADTCGEGKKRDKGRGILGGVLGGAVNQVVRSANLPSFVPVPDFSDQLTESIACRLDPEEQKQAAEATLTATRSDDGSSPPELGTSVAWTSASRENVSGTSTVTGRDNAGGEQRDCISVTDVVIVQGEETRAEKRMCRAPGSARYSIVA